jgi:hypothetical protein
VRETAYISPVEVHKTKEDFNIAVATRRWPLCYGVDHVRLHFDAFWRDMEPNKADLLHLKFVFRQLQVEACFL